MRALFTARALIPATVAGGCALLAVAVLEAGRLPLDTLALLAAAAFLTERFVVPRDATSFDPRDRSAFTFSASVHIAAVLVLGVWAGALVAAFGVLAADGLDRYPLNKLGFNAAASALAAASGGLVFQVLGGRAGALDLPADFPAIALMAIVVYGVGALLVSAAIALESGTPFAPTAREGVLTGLASLVGEAGVGVALAFFILTEPWAAVALLPLVIAVYRSHERLVTLRRETAHALETFANVVDERDPYTYRHSARVAEYVRSLAEALDLPARTVAQLRWAGRLHDLGKISVDAAVLRKPGKLDPGEWEAMRLHPRLSARLLRRFRLANDQAKAVEFHHERFDGKGYYGIDPVDLPLAAHFLVVADSYDAMTSDRPYRDGLPAEVALAEIERNAGSQFHPTIAKAFVALQRGIDPLAALTSGERAEIRRLTGARPSGLLRSRLAAQPALVATGGVLAALVAIAFGFPLLALPGALLVAVGVTLDRLDDYRARRLNSRLCEIAGLGAGREGVFEGLVDELSAACDLRWAGLLAWWEQECTGSLEVEWSGGAHGPSETALTSWLLREAESSAGPLVAAGAELGRPDAHLVVPLHQEGSLRGYLVLAVGGAVPRSVEGALRGCADHIAWKLVAPAGAGSPRLQAVAF